MKLTIHIIVIDKNNLADRQNVFVAMEGISRIRRFRKILTTESHEKAMLFAVTRGRIIDQTKLNGSAHVILTKDSAHWDLMQ